MKELWKNRVFKKLLIIESIIVLMMFFMVIRKPFCYELNVNNMEITDASAYYNETGERVCISGVELGEEDAGGYARWIGGSSTIDVPFGIYEIEAFYKSELYPIENGGGSCADKTAIIELISNEVPNTIEYNPLGMYDGSVSSKERVAILAFTGIDDLQIKICFMGMGKYEFEKVILRELPIWRFSFIAGILLSFAFFNGLFYYFFVKSNPRRIEVIGILGTILFTSIPMLTDFLFKMPGHDLDFHMARIFALANEIGQGRWITPISDTVNHHGYPTPIFYGQLFLYIPAILYNLALPLQTCYQLYAIIVNAATCLISYFCFKAIVKDGRIAVIGAFLYTAAPYRICNIYLRSAVGEYTAMVFLPLIVYGFIKVYMTTEKEIKNTDWLPITFGLTGVIHSHLLSCEMVAIFIIAFCVVYIKKTLNPLRFWALFKAATITFLLNLGFLIPLLDSMQMDLNVNTRRPVRLQCTGVYLTQLLSPFMTYAGGDVTNGMAGEMPLTLGFAFVLGMILVVLCYSKKADWKLDTKLPKVGVVCTVIAICSLTLSLRIFPWDSIENISEISARLFGMVQFCWRYLTIGTVMASFATVIGLSVYVTHTKRRDRGYIGYVLVSITLMCVSLFFTQFCNSAATLTMYGYVGDGVQLALGGGGEYLPSGTTSEGLNRRNINTDVEVVSVEDYRYEKGITTFWCKNTSQENSYVEIPVLKYDHYYAFDRNTEEEIAIDKGENGLIKLILPAKYEGYIQVEYRIPLLWKTSYVISGMMVLCIVGYLFMGLYRNNKRNRNVIRSGE